MLKISNIRSINSAVANWFVCDLVDEEYGDRACGRWHAANPLTIELRDENDVAMIGDICKNRDGAEVAHLFAALHAAVK